MERRMELPERYNRTAVLLHWVIAALVVTNLVVGCLFEFLPKGALRPAIDLHKSFGLTVLGLAILRLLWRLTHAPPPLPPYSAWERRTANAVHGFLYAMMFVLPISGWMHDSAWKGTAGHPMKLYFVIPFFRIGAIEHLDPVTKAHWHGALLLVHATFAYLIAIALVMHVAGALKHQFIDGVPEVQRMWWK